MKRGCIAEEAEANILSSSALQASLAMEKAAKYEMQANLTARWLLNGHGRHGSWCGRSCGKRWFLLILLLTSHELLELWGSLLILLLLLLFHQLLGRLQVFQGHALGRPPSLTHPLGMSFPLSLGLFITNWWHKGPKKASMTVNDGLLGLFFT